MKELIYVFIGGGLGSLVRFLLGKWVNALHNSNFPFGTFTINIIACFVLGFIIGLADQKQLLSPASRLFWAVGFCEASAPSRPLAAKHSHSFNKVKIAQCFSIFY